MGRARIDDAAFHADGGAFSVLHRTIAALCRALRGSFVSTNRTFSLRSRLSACGSPLDSARRLGRGIPGRDRPHLFRRANLLLLWANRDAGSTSAKVDHRSAATSRRIIISEIGAVGLVGDAAKPGAWRR
jgi:hypothetical protein